MIKTTKNYTLLFAITIVLGVWFICSNILGVGKMFLASPNDTFNQLIELAQTSDFWKDVSASWLRVFAGFIISLAVAYPATILSLMNDRIKGVVFYIVEFFRYLPIPVFIPLTILWLGVGDSGKVMIVFLGTFAQMIPMFYDSAMLLDKKYDAFQNGLKWGRWKYIINVIVPGSMPYILDNCRLCFGWAWTYVIIAELLGAENGMGFAIIRAQRYLATDKIFAYIIVIGILGVITDRLLALLKIKYFKWL